LPLSLGFAKTIFWGEGFGKTESAFHPATLPEYLYGQNPKKKNVLVIASHHCDRRPIRLKPAATVPELDFASIGLAPF